MRKSSIKKCTKLDIIKKNIFYLTFYVMFSILPTIGMALMPFPDGFIMLIFIVPATFFLAVSLKNFYTYFIKKESYEFYIITTRRGNSVQKVFVKGEKIGLPNNFSELTTLQEIFLNIGILQRNIPLETQLNTLQEEIDENPRKYENIKPSKPKIEFVFIIAFVLISWFFIVIIKQCFTIEGFSKEIFLITPLIQFLCGLIISMILIKIKNKKENQVETMNKPTRYNTNYINSDDDPFADFYNKK